MACACRVNARGPTSNHQEARVRQSRVLGTLFWQQREQMGEEETEAETSVKAAAIAKQR